MLSKYLFLYGFGFFRSEKLKEGRKINAKKILISVFGVLMLSGLLATTVNAAIWPNLPSTVVQLTVVDDTTSYFDSTLSSIPAGFDVTNGEYPGWCIDRSTTMTRDTAHDVVLYSSLDPPAEVGIDLATFNKINYILNHKQGDMMDIQDAIWYFTDNYTPPGGFSTAAQAMIDGLSRRISTERAG